MFVLSVRCPICCHANDHDFRFCQQCAYQRKIFRLSSTISDLTIDLSSIDSRLTQLVNFDQATSYAKQKESLRCELEKFLHILPAAQHLLPLYLVICADSLCIKMLMEKLRFILMVVHTLGKGVFISVPAPCGLSYKTVDSYIGKLRAIFQANGRNGEYDARMGFGNPATDKSLKTYLRLITSRAVASKDNSKTSNPFFVDKLLQLATYLEQCLQSSNLTPTQRFLFARDQAYFKAVLF